MPLNRDDYVKIIGVDGNFRYGYIEKVTERGWIISISFYEEGRSKIGYDSAQDKMMGRVPVNWNVSLSEAEKRLVPLIANGLSTKEIAEQLSISPVTVRSQLRTLRNKLGVDDKTQLLAFAQGLHGILEFGE